MFHIKILLSIQESSYADIKFAIANCNFRNTVISIKNELRHKMHNSLLYEINSPGVLHPAFF
jgi:hypothetical protein